MGAAACEIEATRNMMAAIKSAPQMLGNRPPACPKYYVHPAVLECYSGGHLPELMKECAVDRSPRALPREEGVILELLQALPNDPIRQ